MKFISSLFVFLFFGLISFVFSVKTVDAFEKKGNNLDPPFICKKVVPPKIYGGIKKEVVSEEDNQKTLVIFAAFADADSDSSSSEEEEEANEELFIGEKSVSRYFKKITQNKIVIDGDILSGWKSLPKTHREYSENMVPGELDTISILTDTITAIDNEVNLAGYQRIVIFLKGGYYSVGFGTQGKWDGIESDDGLLSISVCWIGIEDISNQFMLRHEIGHTLDWGHAGSTVLRENETCSEVCPAKDITSIDFDEVSECVGYEYGNKLDIMGNEDSEENYSTSVFNLRKIGAVDDGQIFEAKESATVTLIPRSSNSQEGFKLVSTEGIDDDGAEKVYHVELYAKIEENFDFGADESQIIIYCTNEDGYLDYVSTLRFMSQNEENPHIPNPFDFKTSFCDPVSGVKIELIEKYGEGEDVRAEIKITLDCPEKKNPVVSVSSEYSSGIDTIAISERKFEIKLSVVNNGAMACGTRTFNVTVKLPEAWTISSFPSVVDIGPFSSFETEVTVEIPEDATDGFYNLIFRVVDFENTELKEEESLTVEFFPKEMTLFVTINEINVTNNEEVAVSRGDWVRIVVSGRISDGNLVEILQADKIACKITNPKGKVKLSEEQENVYEGSFNFKVKRKAPLGEYWVEIAVYEDGYHTASFQTSFKAQ